MYEKVSVEQHSFLACSGSAGALPEQRLQWHSTREPSPLENSGGEEREEIRPGDPLSSAPSKADL